MRLRAELLLALALAAAPAANAAEAADKPTLAQAQAAVEALRNDPALHPTETTHTLRLKQQKKDAPPKPEADPPWLRGLGRWLSEAGRALMWALGALVVAVVLVSLRRWARWRGESAAADALQFPSHVRDLDIRPDSLPADVGAAARALWERGEARAALSLLYRGALSRLVHRHAVPIRAASTEGECVGMARRRLPGDAAEFFARLVQAWQLTVYGAHRPEDAAVLALCADFDARLGGAAPAETGS